MHARNPDVPPVVVDREGWTRRQADGFDSGEAADPVLRFVVKLLDLFARIPQLTGIHRDERDPVDRKSQVCILRGNQAAGQQRGDDQQQCGDRHLSGDDCVADRPAPRAAGEPLLAAQFGGHVRPRGENRRRQPGDHRRDQRRGYGPQTQTLVGEGAEVVPEGKR